MLNNSSQKFSRRKFLAATLALPSSHLINTKNVEDLGDNFSNKPSKLPLTSKNNFDSKHLAWVWQFQHDGDRELIRDRVIIKDKGNEIDTKTRRTRSNKRSEFPIGMIAIIGVVVLFLIFFMNKKQN